MRPPHRSRDVGLVVLGGTAGTVARHSISERLNPEHLFALGTFTVNITGSFVIGALLTILALHGDDSGRRRDTRLLLGTGLLGGYTTYSALAVETQTLLRDDHLALGLSYALGSVVVGLVAAFAGIAAGRLIAR